MWGFLNINNSFCDIKYEFLSVTGSSFLSCNSEIIKMKLWLHFYCLPSLFSGSPIMHKHTDTTSLVHEITFCNDVNHAHILVKILNIVSDLWPTCHYAGGKSTFLSGSDVLFVSWLALWILIYPFPTPFTENRKDPINSKAERKEMLWKLLGSALPWPGSPLCIRGMPLLSAICVCLSSADSKTHLVH